MTVTILPNAKTQFFSAAGVPLAGGSVYMYVPSTTTFSTTWQDSGATIPNTNPIILDGAGECLLWGTGRYRQVVYDASNNLVWDQITEDPGYAIMATFNGTSTTSLAIGTGSKSLTTQTGLQFFPGGTVTIADSANGLNYMNGIVTSYTTSTGALVVDVLTVGGSGTFASWNIAVSGVQGPAGTVTAISIASANGFAGSSSGGGTPQLTLSTSVTGVVKGNGTALSAATAGTDYSAGTSGNATGIVKSTTGTGALTTAVSGTDYSAGTASLATGILKSTTSTGALSIAAASTDYIAPNTGSALVNEAMLNFTNNATANVTTSAHGLAPILPGNVSLFLNGNGGYTAPVVSALVGTSTSSNTIGTGTITFTTQAGLTLGAGQFVVIPDSANSANYFFGSITSYSGTTLVINSTVTGGSGTFASWNIFISGPQGPQGSGTINAGTINDLAYYAATGSSISALATANNGILVTSSGGVPSIATAIPNGVTATTQSAADSSTKIATTAFVNGTALTLAAGTTAVTQSPLNNSTKVATTAYTDAAVAAISSPIATYVFTDATDHTLAYIATPPQTNISSTQTINIPASGRITLDFTGELISATSVNSMALGILIGSTPYWGTITYGGTTAYQQAAYVPSNVTATYASSGVSAPAANPSETSLVGAFTIILDIAALSIPTGSQTVQIIGAKLLTTNALTLKGTVQTTQVYMTVTSF